jgi:hypothetical protein
MKKSLIYLSLIAFLFAACSGNQPKEHDHNDGTHQHDAGSVHADHSDSAAKQKEFTVPADSTSQKKEAEEHTHEGHEHPHKH